MNRHWVVFSAVYFYDYHAGNQIPQQNYVNQLTEIVLLQWRVVRCLKTGNRISKKCFY